MKAKISITVGEKTLEHLSELRKDPRYRNKSHVVEAAINDMLAHNGGRI